MVPLLVSKVAVFDMREKLAKAGHRSQPSLVSAGPETSASDLDLSKRADVVQEADLALRTARVADLTAVLDEQMRQHRPTFAREQLHQILLDLHRVGLRGESEAMAHAPDVRIDDDALVLIEGVSENDVRGLSTDARQLHERVHFARDVSAVTFGQSRSPCR